MIRFDRYKDGKLHILTMSYDDGRDADRRLVEIFNKYGIRGSFHLNSGLLGKDGYVTAEEVPSLYSGHEVSSHTVTHPHLDRIAGANAVKEVLDDRMNLEKYSGSLVRGMSYPFGTYNDSVLAILKQCGMKYSRTVAATASFDFPNDFLQWHPTCHHRNALECAEKFIYNFDFPWRIPLFYVWGHSYEFNNDNNWQSIEEFCKRMGGRDNVWYATNIEIVDYITAQRNLQISVDNSTVYNPSALTVWFSNDGETIKIEGGQTIHL